MTKSIATSTSEFTFPIASRRRLDRTANGNLWVAYWDGTSTTTTSMQFRYSTDNGSTWNGASTAGFFGFTSTGATYTPTYSFFIDLDDYAHIVYKDRSDGFIYYRRGTPDAGRTSWTWIAAVEVGWNNTSGDLPDIVAHREGTGWKVHMVSSYVGGVDSRAQYYRLGISSGGTVTHDTTDPFMFENHSGNTVHKYPSIDFNHTGDGKTVAGSTPHLYVAYSAGATGAGEGIRFKKATYSGGTWTWGAEREIDNANYVFSSTNNSLKCLYDGTRVIIGGAVGSPTIYTMLYERDANDTTTVTRTLETAITTGTIAHGSDMTYDSSGNVYFIGADGSHKHGNGRAFYRIWNRAAGTYGGPVYVDTQTRDGTIAPAWSNATANTRKDFVYSDNPVSPFEIKYSYVGDPHTETNTYSTGMNVASTTATGYSNQKNVDRCSNGVVWVAVNADSGTADAALMKYSTNDGVTWSVATLVPNGSASATQSYTRNLSFFIDQDDYAHLVFKDNSSGFIYYKRGTPNAARTSWTWSGATTISASTTQNYPDIVVHREGTGWVAHVMWSQYDGGSSNWARYQRVDISSTGTVTLNGTTVDHGSYAQSSETYPSIDFNHTGDGKTVAGGTPHVYAAWSAGGTGAGLGIRFRKATYSAGTWTWGTEREIDSTRHVGSSLRWLNCIFGGGRVNIVAGSVLDPTSKVDSVIYFRNTADTTTTTYVVGLNMATSERLNYGSASIDTLGNIYLYGLEVASADGLRKLSYRKFDDSTFTLGPRVDIDTTSGGTPYISAKRHHSGLKNEFVYLDGPTSTYVVVYGRVSYPPNQPTVVAPSDGDTISPLAPYTVSWLYSDQEGGQQRNYELSYRKEGYSQFTTLTPEQSAVYPNRVKEFQPTKYHRLNEPAGTVNETAEVGINGTYSGTAVLGQSSSIVPNATAAGNGYMTLPSWQPPSQITMMAWFKCESSDLDVTTSYKTLWGFGTNNWDARFNSPTSVTCHTYNVAGDAASTIGGSFPVGVNDGQWHMLAITWDGPGGVHRLYLDGVQRGGGTFATGSVATTQTAGFAVGAASTTGTRTWTGDHAEFAVMPRVLTQNQIIDLYQAVSTLGPVGTQHTIPASTFVDESVYQLKLRIADIDGWSEPVSLEVLTNSWSSASPVTSSTQSGTIDTTGFTSGNYQAAVGTYDVYQTGEPTFSSPATFAVTSQLDLPGNESFGVSITETSSILKTSTSTDSGSIAVSEATALFSDRVSSDTGSLAVSEGNSILKNSYPIGNDGAGISIGDTSSSLRTIPVTDGAAISVSDSGSVFKTLASTDSASIAITSEISAAAIIQALSAADAQGLRSTETTSMDVTALMPGAENITTSISESTLLFIDRTQSASESRSLAVIEFVDLVMFTFSEFSSADGGSISVASTTSVVEPDPDPGPPEGIGRYIRDLPVGLWPLAEFSTLQDASGYSRTAILAGTQRKHAPLVKGANYSQVVASDTTLEFPCPVFRQGMEGKAFSLEATLLAINTSEEPLTSNSPQQVMSHAGELDGLSVNGNTITFSTEYLTAPSSVVQYELPERRSAHVVGVHTAQKNSLYVDGALVAEVDITEEQQADQYAHSGNLFAGATDSSQRAALNGVAVYPAALSSDSIRQHYLDSQVQPSAEVTASLGGTRIDVSRDTMTKFLNQRWSDSIDWSLGYAEGINSQNDRLEPALSDGTSVSGYWITAVPLDTGLTSVYGVNLFWNGKGAVVQTSLDGATWATETKGVNVASIPDGFDPAGQLLHIKVSFPGGILDDDSYLDFLEVCGYESGTASINGKTVTLTGAAYPKKSSEPMEYSDDWGVELRGGTLTIAASTGTDAIHPQTLELWIKKFDADAISTNFAGTMYVNGELGTPATGEWSLVHIVASAPVTTDITITGDYEVGQVALYGSAVPANQIKEIHKAYTGGNRKTIQANIPGIGISEDDEATYIYSQDWSITSAG